MTKKELQKRIEELEELVNHQKRVIDVLFEYSPKGITLPPYCPPSEGDCPMGGWHEYPSIWHSVTPPFCKKCGHQAPDMGPTYTTSATDSTDKL